MSFLDLYTKIDAGETLNQEVNTVVEEVVENKVDVNAPVDAAGSQASVRIRTCRCSGSINF
jgi:hypothetical protein